MSDELPVPSGSTLLPPFLPVAQAFFRVLAATGGGGALSVIHRGDLAINLWGGVTERSSQWTRQTVACGWSVSKGITAFLVQRLVHQRALDLDAPIALYWPEFASNGKGDVTLRHVLTHTAALPTWRGYEAVVSIGSIEGWDRREEIGAALAAAPLLWPAGAAISYHAHTYGWLLEETVRRATGRSLSDSLSEVTTELDLHLSYGLPRSVADWAPLRRALLPDQPARRQAVLRGGDPGTLIGAAMLATSPEQTAQFHDSANAESFRRAVHPGANAFANAESLARLYAAILAAPDEESGPVSRASVLEHTRVHSQGVDLTVGGLVRRGLGYALSSPGDPQAMSPGAFGHAGLGGQIAFADPDNDLAFAFLSDTPIWDDGPDWRANWMVAETYACLGRIGGANRGGR